MYLIYIRGIPKTKCHKCDERKEIYEIIHDKGKGLHCNVCYELVGYEWDIPEEFRTYLLYEL